MCSSALIYNAFSTSAQGEQGFLDLPWLQIEGCSLRNTEVFAQLLEGTSCCHRQFGPREISQRPCSSHTCNEPDPGLGLGFTLVSKTPSPASGTHTQLNDEWRTVGLPHFRRIWPTPEIFRMWVNGLGHRRRDFLWVGENISGESRAESHREQSQTWQLIFPYKHTINVLNINKTTVVTLCKWYVLSIEI